MSVAYRVTANQMGTPIDWRRVAEPLRRQPSALFTFRRRPAPKVARRSRRRLDAFRTTGTNTNIEPPKWFPLAPIPNNEPRSRP
jgi:hypothetical protein